VIYPVDSVIQPLKNWGLGVVSRKPRKLFGPVKLLQEVSGAYTSPFLDTDDLKIALRARKLSGAFEKRAPGPLIKKTIPCFRNACADSFDYVIFMRSTGCAVQY